MQIDIHQHIWTDPLLHALADRECLPFVRRDDGLTVLHSADELPYVIDVSSEAPEQRAALVAADGLDRALIAISSPIGIECLPRREARELISAHLAGVHALGEPFGAWGPVALRGAQPDDIDELLAGGCVGISMPAGALARHDTLNLTGRLLGRIAALGVPLFIHPGAAPGAGNTEAALDEPLWWPALTHYVSQMQAAWLMFATRIRREHPDLVAVFAMLAGCAPLQAERLLTRGGPALDLRDPLTFYDTSSYGPSTVETLAQLVGADRLVYGSDRPVLEPMPTGLEPLLKGNAGRLLASRWAAA